jgi:alpha-methylacyl-CoA racemase
MSTSSGPLAGVRIIELGGIGPGPYCGMLLADLGADVIRVDPPSKAGRRSGHPVLHRNRRSVAFDLKNPDHVEAVLGIVARSDALIEGFRPGVAERLGLGPQECHRRNPRLVYGRMTGWGQDGPLAHLPGHDINYIAIGGALGAIGAEGDCPPVPVNFVGDMGGGGLLLAFGIASALYHAAATGVGQVVDAAMTDGAASQLALVHGMMATGVWVERRGANAIDGAAPYYRTYRTADGGFMAMGCAEPQFYAVMLRVLGLTHDPLFARQDDRAAWPAMARRLAAIFAARTRDEWTDVFAAEEACVTPVLGLREAAEHPHNAARGTYLTEDGVLQPAPAPRFLATPAARPRPARRVGQDTEAVLAELGITAAGRAGAAG